MPVNCAYTLMYISKTDAGFHPIHAAIQAFSDLFQAFRINTAAIVLHGDDQKIAAQLYADVDIDLP